jgi:hypothetical protein
MGFYYYCYHRRYQRVSSTFPLPNVFMVCCSVQTGRGFNFLPSLLQFPFVSPFYYHSFLFIHSFALI